LGEFGGAASSQKSASAKRFVVGAAGQYHFTMIRSEDVEKCRALVSEISRVALEAGGYEAQRSWIGPSGAPVHHSSFSTVDKMTAEFVKNIPSNSVFLQAGLRRRIGSPSPVAPFGVSRAGCPPYSVQRSMSDGGTG
jgi:hypothetical protein